MKKGDYFLMHGFTKIIRLDLIRAFQIRQVHVQNLFTCEK